MWVERGECEYGECGDWDGEWGFKVKRSLFIEKGVTEKGVAWQIFQYQEENFQKVGVVILRGMF